MTDIDRLRVETASRIAAALVAQPHIAEMIAKGTYARDLSFTSVTTADEIISLVMRTDIGWQKQDAA